MYVCMYVCMYDQVKIIKHQSTCLSTNPIDIRIMFMCTYEPDGITCWDIYKDANRCMDENDL